MWVMYVDESGAPKDTTFAYYVLAGMAVYERSLLGLSRALDAIHDQHLSAQPETLEFHASEIRSPRDKSPWRQIDKSVREVITVQLGQAIGNPEFLRWVKLFSVAIQKRFLKNDGDVVYERALSELCKRFDLFLRVESARTQVHQHGMLIFDESRLQVETRELMNSYRTHEHEWVTTGRIVEIPFFADSRHTRLLQAADYVAYALFRRYEHGDASYLNRIGQAFHQDDEVMDGLIHLHDSLSAVIARPVIPGEYVARKPSCKERA